MLTRQRCTQIKCHLQQAARGGSSDVGADWFLLKTVPAGSDAVRLQLSGEPESLGWRTTGCPWLLRGWWAPRESMTLLNPMLCCLHEFIKCLCTQYWGVVWLASHILCFCALHALLHSASSCKQVYLKEFSEWKRDYVIEQPSVPYEPKLTHTSLLFEFVSLCTGPWFLFSPLAHRLPCTSKDCSALLYCTPCYGKAKSWSLMGASSHYRTRIHIYRSKQPFREQAATVLWNL